MINFVIFFFFCLLGWIAPHSWGGPEEALFKVEISVTSQTEKERENNTQQALLRLLTKVTGLKNIPRSEEVLASLKEPGRFYSGFSYKENTETQDFTITYNFDKNLVLDLVRESNLPYWWSDRPRVVVWLALEEGSEKILSSSDNHIFQALLRERADERGISLKLPIMDVEDRRLISYKELRSGLAYNIDAASVRYSSNISLIGKVEASELSFDEPYFDGSWEFWFEDEHFNVDFETLSARESAQIGVDLIADIFAARFAVFSGSEKKYNWIITGITDLSKYVGLKNYFENLEIIDEFFISNLSRDQVTLNISSRASEQKIRELLIKKKVIHVDPFYRGPNSRFRWGKG